MTYCFVPTTRALRIAILVAATNVGTSFAQEKAISKPEISDPQRVTAVPSESAEAAVARFVTECVLITPGKGEFPATFSIGTKDPAAFEIPLKRVSLKQPFRISRFETTQELYTAVVGTNPSRWKGPRNSVENVTFQDAERFCRKLTALLHARELISKQEFVRLPTSVEWEYCCRAGSESRYCFGDDAGDGAGTETLDTFAWHTGNAAGNDPAVGVLKANDWGLCDVHGYLWEYVADEMGQVNPDESGPPVIRGGSWKDHHSRLSCSAWSTIPAESVDDAVGFRCVIAEKPTIKKPPKQ
ncbi:MAG: formylglycine-generating enzyme family protein [Planctomycetaceae bacterium]